jgi:TPR repeat protein
MKNALKVVVGAAVAVVAINALFLSPETVDDPLKGKEAEGEEFAEFGSVTAETKAKAEAAAAEKAVAAEKAAARWALSAASPMLSTWRGEEKVAAAEKAAAWHAAKKAADAEALIERRQKFAETKKQAESGSQMDGTASDLWRQGQVQIKLGLMYAKGDGVDQDKEEAAKWFRRAKFHLLNEEIRLQINTALKERTFELALRDATPIVKQKANEWFNPAAPPAPDFAPFAFADDWGERGKVDVPDENLAKVYSLIGLLLLDEDKEKEDQKEGLEKPLEWFGKAEKVELDRKNAIAHNGLLEELIKKTEGPSLPAPNRPTTPPPPDILLGPPK